MSLAALVAVSCSSDGGQPDDGGTETSTSSVGESDGHDQPGGECVDTTATAEDPQAGEIVAAAEQVMEDNSLKAVLLRVERGGEEIVTAGLGQSLDGVPATPDMRFWNGATMFTYLGTVMLLLHDEGVVDIDAPIDQYLPDAPNGDQITPAMLLSSMSGYTDFERMEDWLDQLYADPFRAFTTEELEAYVFPEPLLFVPGTNVAYSHLNFRLAGQVIEQATGQPLAEVLRERFLDPLGMDETISLDDAAIPQPLLHTFSDERGVYEETTGWSPAWGVPEGGAMITTVCDVVVGGAAVGSGELISDEAFDRMLNPGTVGVGERTEECPACIPMTEELHLGMGITVAGDWIVQTPLFTGIAGIQAYLPSEDLSIAVTNTYAQGGDVDVNGSTQVFQALAELLAPEARTPDF